MHTVEDGATAPIEVPAFVDTYIGSRHHVPKNSGKSAGYTLHFWEIRGNVFMTIGTGTEVHKPCDRCGGEGHYMFNTLDGTVCYGCWGDGLGAQLTGWDAALKFVKGREARQRAAARKAMREAWDAAHAWDAWYGTRKGLIAALLAQPRDEYTNEFRTDFLGKMATLVHGATPLTEKQEAAAARTLGQRTARAEAKQAAGHWGAEKKRGEVEVTIRYAAEYEGDYGTRYRIVMETAAGQTLVTWSSGEFGWETHSKLHDADGNRVTAPVVATIKATVKEGGHGQYGGTPQTEVQRVTVVRWH